MNSYKFRFTLDLTITQSQVSIPVPLGDTSREFHINLSNGGVPYTIVDGCVAKITIERPLGPPIEEDCIIAHNTTIIYSVSQNSNTTTLDGLHKCYITLFSPDGTKLVSPTFIMVVNKKGGNTDYSTIIDELQEKINALEKLKSDFENSAKLASPAKIAVITLDADKWIGEDSPYQQVVNVEGVTANSQVDITPSAEQLNTFYEKDVSFVTENENGVVTVYLIGQKPKNDYTFQVTITEVHK